MRCFSIDVIILLILTCSCAQSLRQDCQLNNWETVGIEDAVSKLPIDTFMYYKNECKKNWGEPSESNYKLGYLKGLKQSCTYKTGFNDGNNQLSFNQLCQVNGFNSYSIGFNEAKKNQQERRLDKNKSQTRLEYFTIKDQLLNSLEAQSCNDSTSCRRSGFCEFKRCRTSGEKCQNDQDCQVHGVCRQFNRYSSQGDVFKYFICSY